MRMQSPPRVATERPPGGEAELLQREAPVVERRRIELRAELLERVVDVCGEHVLDDADRGVVVEGEGVGRGLRARRRPRGGVGGRGGGGGGGEGAPGTPARRGPPPPPPPPAVPQRH